MRALLLFRGSAGCGKSTYIKNHGLKPYTLCADDIRLLCQSPILQTNGEYGISQNNENIVWNTLFRILETRMQNGEFTVIDATNSKTAEMNKYKELAKDYRYRIYCIDMTDIPIEEVKRRNVNREEIKRVPEEVIDKFYSRFATQQIPSGIKVLKPDELDTIWYRPMDLSAYNKIHVIGDIHGCYTTLKEYIDTSGGIKANEFYIFAGDYVDRGIENAETVNYLCGLSETYKDNIVFLEGNHERWLWLWANDTITKSKEFEFVTKPQLTKGKVSKKKVREFYRKLSQCCYFTYRGKTFIVTHGGISNIPFDKVGSEINELAKIGVVSTDKIDITSHYNLLLLSTEQMIKGVGRYSDTDTVDQSFVNNTPDNYYQIHGHRNVTNSPIMNTERTFNLEGQIEFGGNLRAVQILEDKFIPIEIPNHVFKETKVYEEEQIETDKVDMTVYSLVTAMRGNRNIYEKSFGKISSFNFTKQAFKSAAWGDIVNKARGLYIDVEEYKIVARAYDKFFNINERPETKFSNLRYKLQFPVTAYIKENGFLGIVGWNTETNDLLITSKSNPTGEFSEYLKRALYSIYGSQTIQKMKTYIKDNDVSFIFECCDMINDPHIIEYPESKVVLLDIVKNKITYEKLPYDELVALADNMGFVVKEKAFVIDSWEDFFDWYNDITAEEYKYKGNYIEGFVIEDSVGYMTKIKLHYYKFWKRLRSVAQSVLKYGSYKYTGSLLTPLENEFYGWCKMLYSTLSTEEKEDIREKSHTNVCLLRKMFYQWKDGQEVNTDVQSV